MKPQYLTFAIILAGLANVVPAADAAWPWYMGGNVNGPYGYGFAIPAGYGYRGNAAYQNYLNTTSGLYNSGALPNGLYGYGVPGFGGGGIYGGGFYGGYGMASDPVSASISAMGNLVSAEGQYNQATAKAMVDREEARRKYIENSQKYISDRMELKRSVVSNSNKQREEDLAAQARLQEYQEANRPRPLTGDQLNWSTGAIQWPEIFLNNEFAVTRKSLQELFEKRARYGSTVEVNTQIKVKVHELRDLLRGHIADIPLSQYSEARKFLDRLGASAI